MRSLEDHPLRALVAAGIPCTISTDDPLVFGNSLEGEYLALAEAGYAVHELVDLVRTGWRVALVDEQTRASALADIRRVAEAGDAGPNRA